MILLDTHFLIWVLTGSRRLGEFPWLDGHKPWTVSPVSLLEMQFLAERGRLDADPAAIGDRILRDPRFTMDDPPLLAVVRHAVDTTWTRDPFDRLLVGHSLARRIPFCSVDVTVLANHPLVPQQLRARR